MSQSYLGDVSPTWRWTSIQGKVRTQDESDMSFGTHIYLQNLNHDSGTCEDSNVDVNIEAKGSFQFDEEQGWKWHKSWILPEIKVKLDITNSQGNQCLSPKNTYVELLQVKQVGDLEWESVGIRGQSKAQVKNNEAEFPKGLRLSQTSYGHRGARFHLVLAAYVEHQGQKRSLFSYASPSIFVDSRKSDREFKQQRELNFTELFTPEQFEKTLSKQLNNGDQLEIDDSTDGFFNFITASNLRNKIKHPLYLAVKFSRAFQLMCKGEQPSDKQLLKMLERLQCNLVYRQNNCKIDDESLIMISSSFKEQKRNRKLNESLKRLSNLMTIIRDNSLEEIQNLVLIPSEQIKRVYVQHFSRLQSAMRKAKAKVYNMKENKESMSSTPEDFQDSAQRKQVKLEQFSEVTPTQVPQIQVPIPQKLYNHYAEQQKLMQNYLLYMNMMRPMFVPFY